jgi:hypothetical protein
VQEILGQGNHNTNKISPLSTSIEGISNPVSCLVQSLQAGLGDLVVLSSLQAPNMNARCVSDARLRNKVSHVDKTWAQGRTGPAKQPSVIAVIKFPSRFAHYVMRQYCGIR